MNSHNSFSYEGDYRYHYFKILENLIIKLECVPALDCDCHSIINDDYNNLTAINPFKKFNKKEKLLIKRLQKYTKQSYEYFYKKQAEFLNNHILGGIDKKEERLEGIE